jgi:hypothetical protein
MPNSWPNYVKSDLDSTGSSSASSARRKPTAGPVEFALGAIRAEPDQAPVAVEIAPITLVALQNTSPRGRSHSPCPCCTRCAANVDSAKWTWDRQEDVDGFYIGAIDAIA